MPLFGRKYDYESDYLPQTANRFKHLERVAQPNRALVREPRMDGNGTTVVFLPYPDFEAPDYQAKGLVVPDRASDHPRDYGEPGTSWLFGAEGVRRFGKNPVTLLFDNPDDAAFNPWEHHPVHLIYDAVIRTKRSRQMVPTPVGTSDSDRWQVLLDGDEGAQGAGQYGSLAKPDKLMLAYALVYNLGDENFLLAGTALGGAPADPPVVFVMTRSTGQSLLEAMDPLPVPITGVKVFHFYDRKKNNCPAMSAAAMAAAVAAAPGAERRRVAPAHLVGQAPVAGQQLAGYGVYVTDSLTGRPGEPTLDRRQFTQFAAQKLPPWRDVLRGHTPDQCAEVVGNTCGLPASLLYYAWKSRPDWYPGELKHMLNNPVTREVRPHGSVPGVGAASGTTVAGTAASGTASAAAPGVPGFGFAAPAPAAAAEAAPADTPGDDGNTFPLDDPGAAYDPRVVAEAQARFRAAAAARAVGTGAPAPGTGR